MPCRLRNTIPLRLFGFEKLRMQESPRGFGSSCRVFVDKIEMIDGTTGRKNRREGFGNGLKAYAIIHHLRNAAGRGSDAGRDQIAGESALGRFGTREVASRVLFLRVSLDLGLPRLRIR